MAKDQQILVSQASTVVSSLEGVVLASVGGPDRSEGVLGLAFVGTLRGEG